MLKTWEVPVDGFTHIISYKKGFLKALKIVDGVEAPLKSKNAVIQLIDEPIVLGNKIANLTVIGNKIDLAVDGVYLGSKQPYVPINNVPAWVNALPIALFVIGWFFCGILGILLGLLSSFLIISISVSPKYKNPVIPCILISVGTIVVQLLLGLAINGSVLGLW